jgi:hypothetical protein
MASKETSPEGLSNTVFFLTAASALLFFAAVVIFVY